MKAFETKEVVPHVRNRQDKKIAAERRKRAAHEPTDWPGSSSSRHLTSRGIWDKNRIFMPVGTEAPTTLATPNPTNNPFFVVPTPALPLVAAPSVIPLFPWHHTAPVQPALANPSRLNPTAASFVTGKAGRSYGSDLSPAAATYDPDSTKHHGSKKIELCKNWDETGECLYGDHCQFAHGNDELRTDRRGRRRHPEWKTNDCRHFLAGSCERGKKCDFIHDETPEKLRKMKNKYFFDEEEEEKKGGYKKSRKKKRKTKRRKTRRKSRKSRRKPRKPRKRRK